jgi:hypothetical protein
MKKIFIAMAETQDGSRAFGNAYITYQRAHTAALEMSEEIQINMGLQMIPLVEEIDLVED